MSRIRRTAGRHLRRVRRIERFVQLIVGGGVALVAGLWMATLARAWSSLWLLGLLVVVLGVGGLAGGIWSQVDY